MRPLKKSNKHGLLNFFTCTTIQKFGVNIFFWKKLTFIHQSFIKWIKSDSKDIYNITKDFHFK